MHCPDTQLYLHSSTDFKLPVPWIRDDAFEDNYWVDQLGDPTSVRCDEMLERQIYCSTPACISCHPCSLNHTHLGKIPEPRSRSEDSRCYRGRNVSKRGPLCTLKNDSLYPSCSTCISRTPSSSGTGYTSPSSISSDCLARSLSCDQQLSSMASKIPDESPDELSSQLLPPPMAKLNSFQLSFRNLLEDNSTDGCSSSTAGLTHLSASLTVTTCSPSSTQLNLNASPSSTIGATELTFCGQQELTLPSLVSYSARPRMRTTTGFDESDTSACDSGLSSHSSNSNYCITLQTSTSHDQPEFLPTDLRYNGVVLIQPPPVPPHAPNSRAAATAAAPHSTPLTENNKLSCPIVSKSCCPDSTGRLKDVTIRLPRYVQDPTRTVVFGEKSTPIHLVSSLIDSLDRPTSPIWKRKQRISPHSPRLRSDGGETPVQTSVVKRESCPASDLPKSPVVCPVCTAAKQHFLYLDALPRLDYVDAAYKGKFNCQTCFAITRNVGVNLFNRDPIRSLEFLEKHGFLRTNLPDSIANFIISTPELCRSQIGAFLGHLPIGLIVPAAVMKCLFRSLDFHGSEVDEALRETVYRFGMPVESQEIGRYLECLAERYHESRWPPEDTSRAPVSVNQVLLLFYSVLLLQTSLHNESAARSSLGKQTVSMFTKNCQGFLFPESETDCQAEQLELRRLAFSSAKLSSICNRIKMKPLVQGFDHTKLVGQITRSLVLPVPNRLAKNGTRHPGGVDPLADLVQPHRRLVFYCTMVQFVRRPNTNHRVGLLRHVFLFNDCILLAKPLQPNRKSRKQVHSAQHQYHLNKELNSLLHGDSDSQPETLRRLLGSQFYPPCGLRPLTSSHALNSAETLIPVQRNSCTQSSSLKSSSVSACLPVSRSAASQKNVLSHLHCNKLVGVRRVPISDCVLRPFQSEECRFGLELLKSHESSEIQQLHGVKMSVKVTTSTNQANWRSLITLAALTQTDYENIVYDLIDCLREVHLLNRELARK